MSLEGSNCTNLAKVNHCTRIWKEGALIGDQLLGRWRLEACWIGGSPGWVRAEYRARCDDIRLVHGRAKAPHRSGSQAQYLVGDVSIVVACAGAQDLPGPIFQTWG